MNKTLKRYLIIYQGIVQGVGFRGTMCYIVSQIGNLTGFVKNLENHDTMVEIQGKEKDINKFIKKSLENLGFIEVYDYSIKEIPVIEEETEFTIKF